MTALKYIDILNEYLISQMREWLTHGVEIYQQDNAPCHKAKSVISYLRDQDIEVMSWPPYSPDLSPIENLWAIIKVKVHKHPILSTTDLINKLNQIWNEDDQIRSHCLALIEGMPRRINACIKAKGGPIKY